MSAAPPNSESLPDDEPESLEGDEESRAASDPEEARKAAEDALAEIEALADLEEEPEPDAEADPEEEEVDPSFGGAVAEASESKSAGEGPPEDQCENCGALLHGPYCSQCGQRAADRIVPIWHMINEALEAAFELDMRVIHTLPKLFFLPGRLTKEYLNGRRKRYIRPFRLYLFSTFLLFATLALTTGSGIGLTLGPEEESLRLASPGTSTAGDTTELAAEQSSDENWREEMARQLEQDSTALNINVWSPSTNALIEQRLRTNLIQALRQPGEFGETVIEYGPYVMFFMVPVFAFFLKLLYVRRGRLYVEHLIFSLHVHALAFFAFTFGVLLNETGIDWLRTAGSWVEAAPFLYLFLGMWHVYEQGFLKTMVKYLILLSFYSFLLLIGFLLLLFVAIVLM